ncbi:terminase [Corynebacterium striatum]|uniref:Terminase n=1 Tax=Corynebacterium striatum TaxID=43770 RepID=A0ABC8CII9_CORST|nr:terminase large subunit [Corynebacterium striatum]ATZ08316.1 terminase [Corynebacterium striatum]EGT5592392.1 terminase [Corynebacterium striatum]EGT5613276.1 terminase [Corynebacterium striatum]
MATLVGSTVPRVFTPPLRELTPETSWGFDVVWFAREILRQPLSPWQEWLAIHGLELMGQGKVKELYPDDPAVWDEEIPRFKTILVLVARQNGKTHFAKTLIKWALFRKRLKYILGAAQTKNDAYELWEDIEKECDENPRLKKRMKRTSFAHGFEALRSNWGVYRIAGLDRKAGRGKTANLLYMDELREHKDWAGWSALSSTTNSPLVGFNVATSNAGDARSVVLRHLRDTATKAINEQRTETATLFMAEWSADPDLDPSDKQGWAQANPDLGSSRLTVRDIQAEFDTKTEAEFRTENLCQWVDVLAPSKFPEGSWASCLDSESRRAPGAKVHVGLDVAVDLKAAHIVGAMKRPDGLWHVELLASRPGIDWVTGWLEQRLESADWFDGEVAVQARGAPVGTLIPRLREAGLTVREWAGPDLTQGTLAFYDLVAQSKLRHRGQPALDAAATGAQDRRAGDAFMWDRSKSVGDVAPIVAATASVWLACQPEIEPPKQSAYETADLMIL